MVPSPPVRVMLRPTMCMFADALTRVCVVAAAEPNVRSPPPKRLTFPALMMDCETIILPRSATTSVAAVPAPSQPAIKVNVATLLMLLPLTEIFPVFAAPSL